MIKDKYSEFFEVWGKWATVKIFVWPSAGASAAQTELAISTMYEF